ncbi:hypothetical protein EBZ39_02320 [bacterium]|nr:hypothetical protein [bacterium]
MIAVNKSEPEFSPPPPHILAWCRSLIDSIKDGGVWCIPRSQIAFRIDKKKKQLKWIAGTGGGGFDDPDVIATRHVFSFLGWEVVKE